jgi:small-conductance mechanosensitive channel
MAKSRRTFLVIVLLVATGLVAFGILWTAPDDQPLPLARSSGSAAKPALVNEQPLQTAQRFARYIGSKEEDEYSREAIRLADHELDLAFSTALRQAHNSQTAANPQTAELRKRVRDLEAQIKDDEAGLKRQSSSADGEDLDLAKAELTLHQEELEDAKEELVRSGDDAESRLQRMLSQHQAVESALQSAALTKQTTAFRVPDTLLDQVVLWRQFGKRLFYLDRARQLATDYSQKLTKEHDELEQRVKQAPALDKKAARKTQVAALKQQANDRQTLAEYGQRIDAQRQLAKVYSSWLTFAQTQRDATVHAMLVSLLRILLIVLVLVAVDFAVDRLLLRQAGDRRRFVAMRMVVRFVLQVVAVIGALFVVFGKPGQLSTLLGLAGAGLTVALKDFIVGFFGWFVLMGKNGIRVGDWVEINGIGGEVVEIGLLRTVLLETGNWTDSGHPTGRKVTFVNSYAIEGHYFNFSTSGQWLWDTLEILIPVGQEPHGIARAIYELVLKQTENDAREAEQEWQRATHDFGVQSFTATPSIGLRPSQQGINVVVRYITHASQRYEIRSRLYEGVVNLLHQGAKTAQAY